MKIEIITIDFWNTLFNSDSGELRNSTRSKVLIDTLKDMQVNVELDLFDTVMKKSWKYYNEQWLHELRTPTATEIINYLWDEMNLLRNEQAIQYVIDFFENSILYFPPTLQQNALSVIQQLSCKYKLAIISDTGFSPGRVMSQLMENIGIKKYFSAFSYSDETGVAKPHPLAFTTILHQLHCSPENALHIGDIERTDIMGAKAVGMYAIRYDGDVDSATIAAKPQESKADFIANDWNEIATYLNC